MLSVLREKGVVLRSSLSQDENHNFIPDDLSNYQVVNEGDLVVNKMKAWQGSVGVAPQDGIVSPAYYVFELVDIKKKYAHRLLRSRLYADFFGRASDGVRIGQWDLRIPAMKRIPVLIPPPDEQDDIARYLDEMDRRIARFIRNRRRLIEVLNEQKQAIINRTVTRGLDPDAPLKPSGIDWLGDIPEHWEAVRFKLRVGFQEGPGIMAADFRDTGIPLLRISCLASDPATLAGCNYLDPAKVREKWQHFRVQPKDYLLSASASTGSVSRASEEVVGAVPYTGILRLWSLSTDVNMEYIRYFIASQPFAAQIDTAKSGVAIEHFGPTHLKRMWICFPPRKEQTEIVAFLEHELHDTNAMIDRASCEIDLIQEYRTRLISDVVTGKVDVRHLAPPPGREDLEERAEALEPLEEDITADMMDDEEPVNEAD
jgi:type I restriction enzyme S subunit